MNIIVGVIIGVSIVPFLKYRRQKYIENETKTYHWLCFMTGDNENFNEESTKKYYADQYDETVIGQIIKRL